MFKDLFTKTAKAMSAWFDPKRMVVIIMFISIGLALMYYSNGKQFGIERLEGGLPVSGDVLSQPAPAPMPSGHKPSAVANPSDLLPGDTNSAWSELNQLNNGGIAMPDMLTAGYHIGMDTIGQSLRNANLQERSDPIIPVSDTGPWNKSTIEPDYGRVPMEIGDGSR